MVQEGMGVERHGLHLAILEVERVEVFLSGLGFDIKGVVTKDLITNRHPPVYLCRHARVSVACTLEFGQGMRQEEQTGMCFCVCARARSRECAHACVRVQHKNEPAG